MAGETDKAKGSIKEGVGNLSDNDRLKAEGKTDKAKGSVKDAAHKVDETAKGAEKSLKRD